MKKWEGLPGCRCCTVLARVANEQDEYIESLKAHIERHEKVLSELDAILKRPAWRFGLDAIRRMVTAVSPPEEGNKSQASNT
jgi:hypothetical protein